MKNHRYGKIGTSLYQTYEEGDDNDHLTTVPFKMQQASNQAALHVSIYKVVYTQEMQRKARSSRLTLPLLASSSLNAILPTYSAFV